MSFKIEQVQMKSTRCNINELIKMCTSILFVYDFKLEVNDFTLTLYLDDLPNRN